MPSNECEKCGMSLKDPLFWNKHQTMIDDSIWCINKPTDFWATQTSFEE